MSEIKKLARLGGDVRKIAALLQSKGRGRDTILAHITPQEAALLKARGGSGTTNPDTGLMEFYTEEEAQAYLPTPQDQTTSESTSASELEFAGLSPDVYQAPASDQEFAGLPIPTTEATPVSVETPEATPSFRPSQIYGPGMTGAETSAFDLGLQTGVPTTAPQAPGALAALSEKTGMSEDFLKRLGLAGIQAIPGAAMQRRAARQAGAQRAELERMAAPYRSQAQALTAQAQAGQLTPVAQQQLQAARAQLAQQRTGRGGGVIAQQDALQLERFRQQLLQQQLDMGLKLSGIADRIQVGAIRAGYQADEQVQQMTADFYNNMFRTLFGQPAQQQPAPRA